MQHDQYALSIISNIIDGHMSIKRIAPCPDVLKYSYILNTYYETANKARFLRRPALESLEKEWDPEMGIAGSIFEPHPPNFGKVIFFEDLQMMLLSSLEIFIFTKVGKNVLKLNVQVWRSLWIPPFIFGVILFLS